MNRLKSKASANTRSTQMAVSSSNGGLGSPTGDLVITIVSGTMGTVGGKGSPWESRGDGCGDKSMTVVCRT